MNAPFGAGPVTVLVSGARTGVEDASLVRARLSDLALPSGGSAGGLLDLATPLPTAAFSRRDTLLPGFACASAAAERHGFAPAIRPVGGHLAAYDEGSLILHLTAPHPEPRLHIRERFAIFGDAVASGLRSLGVDARVGPVPGEYCDGEFSVNDAGRSKLVGTGQRIVRGGFLFSAVVMVHSPDSARAALTDAYAELDLEFRPSTVGCVADSAPGVTADDVRTVLVEALAPTAG